MLRTTIIMVMIVVCFQDGFSQKSKLYIVDSIPVDANQVWNDIKIDTKDIFDYNIILDKGKINQLGYIEIDSLIFITTEGYSKRSDSLKSIPTTKLMSIENTIWYYNSNPYTGAFIDYYINGKKESEGHMIMGKVEGVRNYYYENGSISSKYLFKNSMLEGQQYEYFENGSIMSEYYCVENEMHGLFKKNHENGNLYQKYYIRSGLIDGEIEEFYSTGKLKRKYRSSHPYYLDPKEKEIRNFFTGNEEAYYQFGNNNIINRKELKDSKKILKFLSQMNKLISKNPNIDSYYIHRAILNYIQTDYDNSISDLRKAIELEPNSRIVPYYLSIMLISKYGLDNFDLIPENIRMEICDGLLTQSNYKSFYKDIAVAQLYAQFCGK